MREMSTSPTVHRWVSRTDVLRLAGDADPRRGALQPRGMGRGASGSQRRPRRHGLGDRAPPGRGEGDRGRAEHAPGPADLADDEGLVVRADARQPRRRRGRSAQARAAVAAEGRAAERRGPRQPLPRPGTAHAASRSTRSPPTTARRSTKSSAACSSPPSTPRTPSAPRPDPPARLPQPARAGLVIFTLLAVVLACEQATGSDGDPARLRPRERRRGKIVCPRGEKPVGKVSPQFDSDPAVADTVSTGDIWFVAHRAAASRRRGRRRRPHARARRRTSTGLRSGGSLVETDSVPFRQH